DDHRALELVGIGKHARRPHALDPDREVGMVAHRKGHGGRRPVSHRMSPARHRGIAGPHRVRASR
ncbi:MAG: hypothetical protein ACK55I_05845, partial [bacterium]